MKRIFLVTTGLCAILVINLTVAAQTTIQSHTEAFVSATEHPGKDVADSRVVARFKKNFAGAVNESWMKTKDGFAVRFTAADIQQLVFLNKKGDCTGSIRYYSVKGLPEVIRRQVKSTYYDYSITAVKEVTTDGVTAYLVTIETEKDWKIIRVLANDDMEMNVYEAYLKN